MQAPDKLPRSTQISRRRFNQLIGLTGISCLVGGLSWPMPANAAANVGRSGISTTEKYHIFIGDELAQQGGQYSVTFRSGLTENIRIPSGSTDKTIIITKATARDGGNAEIILHTLYDPSLLNVDKWIEAVINRSPLMNATKQRCSETYQQIKAGEQVTDSYALDLMDIVIAGSSDLGKKKDGSLIQNRYQIASQNSRLIALQAYITDKIDATELPEEQKQHLKGIYQFVRANEPLPSAEDFEGLTTIDAMVQASDLAVPIKQRYAIASAQTRAYTVDEVIMDLIRHHKLTAVNQEEYFKVYNQARLGLKVEDEHLLKSLDSVVYLSDISSECKGIYKLAREQFFSQDEQAVEATLQEYIYRGKRTTQLAAGFVPNLTSLFGVAGMSAGTGTAISALSGGAATNATLAALGGGSVAAGGMGMLGGLAIATGGAALVGAAALASVVLVADMSGEELRRVGLAATAGTLASAAVVGAAWVAVSTYGAAASLSGAAAISASMAALGGATVMTGGAALIAFGVGLGVWQFLRGHHDNRKAVQAMVDQVEPLLYTYTNEQDLNLTAFVMMKNHLSQYQDALDKTYLAPEIPIEKLAHTLHEYAEVSPDEKILAIVDKSMWNNGKAGIAFTNLGIHWKYMSKPSYVAYSDPEYLLKIMELPEAVSAQETVSVRELALELGKTQSIAKLQSL